MTMRPLVADHCFSIIIECALRIAGTKMFNAEVSFSAHARAFSSLKLIMHFLLSSKIDIICYNLKVSNNSAHTLCQLNYSIFTIIFQYVSKIPITNLLVFYCAI